MSLTATWRSTLTGTQGSQPAGMVTQEELAERRQRAIEKRLAEEANRKRKADELQRKREQAEQQRLDKAAAEEREKLEAEQRAQENRDRAERRRLANLAALEEGERSKEEQRLRLRQVERRREEALIKMEAERARAEAEVRSRREDILQKRREAERRRAHDERMYRQKRAQEEERKALLLDNIKRKRDERIIVLEERRNNPLFLQQEAEFKEFVKVQSEVTRLKVRFEELQIEKEMKDAGVTELERQLSIARKERDDVGITLEEVKTELRKVTAYEEGLARLVNTQYDTEDFQEATLRIQTLFRGFKARSKRYAMQMREEEKQQQLAAARIQALHRGNKDRRKLHRQKEEASAVKIQAIFKGGKQREQTKAIKEEHRRQNAATKIQSLFRGNKTRADIEASQEHNKAMKELQRRKRARARAQKAASKGTGQPTISDRRQKRTVNQEGQVPSPERSRPRKTQAVRDSTPDAINQVKPASHSANDASRGNAVASAPRLGRQGSNVRGSKAAKPGGLRGARTVRPAASNEQHHRAAAAALAPPEAMGETLVASTAPAGGSNYVGADEDFSAEPQTNRLSAPAPKGAWAAAAAEAMEGAPVEDHIHQLLSMPIGGQGGLFDGKAGNIRLRVAESVARVYSEPVKSIRSSRSAVSTKTSRGLPSIVTPRGPLSARAAHRG